MPTTEAAIERAYALAQERYAALEIDTKAALQRLGSISISLHCWQGDDIGGFENLGAELGGGLAVTGNYPGKARSGDELRADLDRALSLIPGRHRLNLHANYAETDGHRPERNELRTEHFARWLDEVLLHVSRGLRWDSDHVVTLTDDLRAIAEELVRGDYLGRAHIGLDFFDASINRVAAWVIGARSTLKALLAALLEPAGALRRQEEAGDYTARLATLEELKTLPLGAVWDYHCLEQGVPTGADWLADVRSYERDVLSKRRSGQ